MEKKYPKQALPPTCGKLLLPKNALKPIIGYGNPINARQGIETLASNFGQSYRRNCDGNPITARQGIVTIIPTLS